MHPSDPRHADGNWRPMTVRRLRFPSRPLLVTLCLVPLGLTLVGLVTGATAAQGPIDLGTANSFAVLAGSTVTNTGPSVVSGDLGVFPGSAVTGFTGPPNGTVVNGTLHVTDGTAMQAQSDLTTAYNQAAGETPCTDETGKVLGQDIGTIATPLLPGVYCFSSSAQLTGSLHLSGAGVYIFQIGSTLTTAPGSSVVLDSNASACDIFWQVGTSATIDTTTHFVGTVMANASISVNNGAVVEGRLLARTGQVSLINDTIIKPTCAVTTTTAAATSTTAAATTTTLPGTTTSTLPGTTTSTAPVTTTTAPGTTTSTLFTGATLPGATTTALRPSTTLSGATDTVSAPTTSLPGATAAVLGATETGSGSTGATGAPSSTTSLARSGQNLVAATAAALVAVVFGGLLVFASGDDRLRRRPE